MSTANYPKKEKYNSVSPENPEGMVGVKLDSAHSYLKALSHPELLKRFIKNEIIRPVHMRIGIIGACNMRCDFCNFHSPNEEHFYNLFSYKDRITTEQAKQLFREFAESDGKAVTFCGSGECTIHPGYVEICRDAKEQGLMLGLITNGTRLHLPDMESCIADTHTWVRIGLNAGTEDTFTKITHYKSNGGALSNILKVAGRIKDKAVDSQFKIGFNYVVTCDNYTEIHQAAKIALESGVHYIRFEPEFYSALGHKTIEEKMPYLNEAFEKTAALSNDEFEVSIPKLNRGPMDQTMDVEGDFSRCHYSRFVTAVGADGQLYPCPQVHLNSQYRIGNVLENGYLNVLEGGERKEWEEQNPLRTELCKTCFYRPQNELLEWLQRGDIDLEDSLSQYKIEVPETLHKYFI